MKLHTGYKTATGRTMTMDVYGTLLERTEVPLVPQNARIGFCGTCKGENGGCPTWAPYFLKIKPSLKYFYVVEVVFDMAWAIKYAGRLRDNVICHNYYRMGYADIITDRYVRFIIKSLSEHGYGLTVGHCVGCRSKKECTVLTMEPCKNPLGRTYSLEATGVDCSKLTENLHGTRLSWWYKGHDLPVQMWRTAGILTDHKLDSELIHAMHSHKGYITADQADKLPEYPYDIVEVPSDRADAGQTYLAYTDYTEITV